MPLSDPPRLLTHVYKFFEIGKPPRLYHPPRQFDSSEYMIITSNIENSHIQYTFERKFVRNKYVL